MADFVSESKRLDVSGPDSDGDYEFVVYGGGDEQYLYLSRRDADRLIAVLQAPQPQAPTE